jgi:cell division septation protein DedD
VIHSQIRVLPIFRAGHVMADEQVHEFHLDGKQMVFLFMASTVVAVVIFLCGVMVGRGVRDNKTAEAVAAAAADLADPTASAQATDANEGAAPATPTASPSAPGPAIPEDPTAPPPPPAEKAVSGSAASQSAVSQKASERPRQADSGKPTVESHPAPARETTSRAADERRDDAASSGKDSQPSIVASSYREPAGGGFAVQVMTATRLADAQAEARKLQAKGYNPFLLPMGNGKPGFRVRVGKYKTFKEAESARARLEKVEKYKKPWVPSR